MEPDEERKEAMTATLLDAGLLDEYLFRLLLPKFSSLFFDGKAQHLKWMAWPLLRVGSLVLCRGQTPATQILGLKFSPTTKAKIDDNGWRRRFIFYMAASIFLPTLYDRFHYWFQKRLDENNQDEGELTTIDAVALDRQRRTARLIRSLIDKTVPLAKLCCLLSCWGGLVSTPSLAMILTGWKYEKSNDPRGIAPRLHVDLAHRRWLQQEAFAAARILFAGLWMTRTWRPLLEDWIQEPVTRLLTRFVHGQVSTTTCCPLCHADPIVVPFQASCSHVYCYTCLYKEYIRVKPVRCRICARIVDSSRPLLKSL
jgi:hypothetical protein